MPKGTIHLDSNYRVATQKVRADASTISLRRKDELESIKRKLNENPRTITPEELKFLKVKLNSALDNLKDKDFYKVLTNEVGCVELRQKGSHVTLVLRDDQNNHHKGTFAWHSDGNMPMGTAKSLLEQLGILSIGGDVLNIKATVAIVESFNA